MNRYTNTLVLLAAFSLAAVGCADSSEELSALQAELDSKTTQLTELEAQIAECDCPVDEPEPEPEPEAAAPPPAPEVQEKPAATVGQLEVKATSAVKVLLDGKPMRYKLARSAYISESVSPGTHLIEVQNNMAKVVASTRVTIQSGKRTRFQYKAIRKNLEQLGTVDAH